MKSELNDILKKEKESIKYLLVILEEQHEYIVKNDIFSLENVTEKLHQCSIEIAKFETERRRITKSNPMSKVINEINDDKLEKTYREIKKLIYETQIQKETNEMLTKQSLIFANKMLMTLNPNRKSKTYNSYGKLGKY